MRRCAVVLINFIDTVPMLVSDPPSARKIVKALTE